MIVQNKAIAQVRAGGQARPLRPRFRREWLWSLFFLSPYLIGLVAFVAGPILGAFAIGFTRWDVITPPRFIGLDNYRRLADTPAFWQALTNTLYYIALVVPAEMIAGFLLAQLVNQKLRAITLFRAVYFMPFVLSLASVALVWAWLYSPEFGLINQILRSLRLPGPPWLGSLEWAMPAIALTTIWRNSGYYMVIFLAGLQTIPAELYEAAAIDGASRLQRLRHVTLPMISPTAFFVSVVAIIWAFQVFDLTYIMTRGGPSSATLTLVYYVYNAGFQSFRMGEASAAAFVLFGIVMAITLVQFRLQKRWVHYD
jgi:multiple sugar transport system permease protein